MTTYKLSVSNSIIVRYDVTHTDWQWSQEINSADLLILNIQTQVHKDTWDVLRYPKHLHRAGRYDMGFEGYAHPSGPSARDVLSKTIKMGCIEVAKPCVWSSFRISCISL